MVFGSELPVTSGGNEALLNHHSRYSALPHARGPHGAESHHRHVAPSVDDAVLLASCLSSASPGALMSRFAGGVSVCLDADTSTFAAGAGFSACASGGK